MNAKTVTDQEYSKVVDFLNENLRPKSKWSIENEYPLAISKMNLKNIFIIESDTKVVSHALVKPHIIKTPAGLFKVGAIGSVVTDQGERNKGYSQTLLKQCLTAATDQGCDFAILWTDLYEFYQKLEFQLSGFELSFVLDQPITATNKDLTFKEGANIDPAALLRVYSQHTVGTVRSINDIQKYLKIPNTKVYTAWDSQNQLKAYAIEGKGVDLIGYVHEWGGNVSDLMALLQFIQKSSPKPITLIASAHNKNLLAELRKQNYKEHKGFLGMIKILNRASLFNKINRYAKTLKINDFEVLSTDSGALLKFQKNTYQITNNNLLTQIIFGPHDKNLLVGLQPEEISILQTVLPLSMWIWGWDSV